MVKLLNVSEVNSLIEQGEVLSIAAHESILKQLKPGNWVGGSIPYFMGPNGGVFSKDQALVTNLSASAKNVRIVEYSVEELAKIPQDYYANGFSVVIIPARSAAHSEFSKNAFSYPNIFSGNLVGWVSGTDLSASSQRPMVFNGKNAAKPLYDKAVVMHVEISPTQHARTEIVNIFSADETGDVIEFLESGYEVADCLVNGKPQRFGKYLIDNKIDTRLPMIADYSGAKINVSFNEVSPDRVSLYASVFPTVKYHLSKPVADYEKAFNQTLQKIQGAQPVYSCNCVLNYLYANLEGKMCGAPGPMTFGEIAFILLNQTMVYLFVEDT